MQPTLYCTPSHARDKQLVPGDDAILPRRQLSNHSIQVTLSPTVRSTSPMFCPSEGLNTGLTIDETLRRVGWRHGPEPGRSRRTRGALNVKSLPKKRGSNPPLPPLALIP